MKMLKMKLFGGFSLTDGNAVLSEETLHSNMMTRLLVFILIHRGSVLTHQKFIDVFWERNSKNPESALKNLMYRLRTALKILGNEEFICTMPGAYCWNPEIPVETDYEMFEQMTAALRGSRGEEESEEVKRKCQQILECYQGNISPRIAEETWILPKMTWYQSLYIDTVKRLCEIYEKQQCWTDLEMLCNRALQTDNLDEELHCYLLKALHGQHKYDMTMRHYEKANQIFYDSIGIQHPEMLKEIFQSLRQNSEEGISNIQTIMDDMKEHEPAEKAFLCDYQIFRQMYRLEARRINRLGIAEYIMLLTVHRTGAFLRDSRDSVLQQSLLLLETLLLDSLRCGDLVARYSSTQYVVMLQACSYEAGVMIANRIQKSFEKKAGKKNLELLFELAEMTSAESYM